MDMYVHVHVHVSVLANRLRQWMLAVHASAANYRGSPPPGLRVEH